MNIEFRIDEFEGPLDLLLHLVKINKMNILDIEIENITEQYLKYLEKMESMNLEITSNYLVTASELLYIKSKMLLPIEKESEESFSDPREELANKLLEYQVYKEIGQALKEKESLRREIYTSPPVDIKKYSDENNIIIETNINLNDLIEAFKSFLIRKKEEKPIKTKVTEKEITVSDRKNSIRNIIVSKKRISFYELFEDYSREYIVATFLAVLEMVKEQELTIKQENNFSDIICEVIR